MKWHMFWIQQVQQPSIQHIGPTLKSWQIPFATLEDNPSTLPKPYRGIKPDEVLILTKSKEASPWVQKQQDVEEKTAMSTKKIKWKWKMTKRISRRRKRKKNTIKF